MAISCVAEAKAAAKAMLANRPMFARGSIAARLAKPATSTHWHSTIQLLRRPSASSTGKGMRSTSGAHRNLNE